jgi:mono/diheme cytochrome c family protein
MKTWNAAAHFSAAMVLISGQGIADTAGEQEYMVACAGCHGESGMGDGTLAGLLNISTPSLVELSQANDGVFPFEAVLTTIDGRDEVRAHGSAMPIWGERFQPSASRERGETAEMVARGRILSLINYLQSIQQ